MISLKKPQGVAKSPVPFSSVWSQAGLAVDGCRLRMTRKVSYCVQESAALSESWEVIFDFAIFFQQKRHIAGERHFIWEVAGIGTFGDTLHEKNIMRRLDAEVMAMWCHIALCCSGRVVVK